MIFVLFFVELCPREIMRSCLGEGRGLLKRLLTERGFASVLCVWRSIYVPCARVLCGSIEWLFLWTRWHKDRVTSGKRHSFPREKTKTNSAHVVCACGTFFFSLGYGYYAVRPYSSRNTTWRQTISTLILISSLLSTSHSLPIPPLSNQKKYFWSSTFWNPNPTPSPGVIFPFWYTGDQQEVELLCVCEIFHHPAQQSCTRPLIPNKETSSEWTNQLPAYALLVCLHFFTPLNRIHLF